MAAHVMQRARPTRAAAALTARLTRRSTLAVCAGVAIFMVFEALAFRATYPDAATLAALELWSKDPAIRIIAGAGSGVQTVGGFAVWDAGLYLTLGLGAWVLTVTTRVLRGDETSGRTDLLLLGPRTARRTLLAQLSVLLVSCLLDGLSLAIALTAMGAQAAGAALYGALTMGYCMTFVGVAALVSQAVTHRRAALGLAAAVFAASVVVRIVGNSTDDRSWLTWLSPAGWIDHSQAFGDNHWAIVAVPILVTTALIAVTWLLRAHRDTGSGLLPERTGHRSIQLGLSSAGAFAGRANLGVLAAWTAGLVVTAAVFGALLPTIGEVLAADEGFQDLISLAGIDVRDVTRGFITMWAQIIGLALALYAAFRMGATRAEEASGRIDLLLARPLPRWRWLLAHVFWLGFGVIVLATASAITMWLMAIANDAPLDWSDPFLAIGNTVPAIAVFAGIATVVFGVRPRVTVAVTIATVVTAFVVDVVGQPLHWPGWLLDLSPFHHLATVPSEAIAWPGAWIMLAIGAILIAFGAMAFHRRDLAGG